jgi:hypothetical protein
VLVSAREAVELPDPDTLKALASHLVTIGTA